MSQIRFSDFDVDDNDADDNDADAFVMFGQTFGLGHKFCFLFMYTNNTRHVCHINSVVVDRKSY